MYEFKDELRFRMSNTQAAAPAEVALVLAYAHHRLVFIHPFTNGNGRTARLLTSALAYVILYRREADDNRKRYLQAIQHGDANGLDADEPHYENLPPNASSRGGFFNSAY